MNLSNFLAVLRARWMVALGVFIAVVAASVAYVVFAKRTYTATASMVIEGRPDPVSSMLYGGSVSPAMINTQLEVIRSDRVALRVVENLKLADAGEMRTEWEKEKGDGSIQDWLVALLQTGLRADVARPGSNVVNISFAATDPRFAAALANGFMQAYLETAIELRVDPARQYSGFFTEQIKEAKDSLEKARAKLSAFEQENGLIASDERLDVEMTRLNMLSQELVAAQGVAAEASGRRAQAGNLTEVQSNAAVAGIKAELSRAEARLQEVSSRYGDAHPQVQEARAAVNDLRRRLDSETRVATGGVAATANAFRAREGEVRASLEAQRTKVLKLKEVRDQQSVLARDVENAQKAYDVMATRYNQTNLESQNRQSNATVISPATPPSKPSSPKVVANLLMGLVAAIGLGIGMALLLEQFDKRVRTPGDAIAALGLPVIGIMPTPTMNRRIRGEVDQNRQRVISGRKPLAIQQDKNA
jgi:polysaccharide biosynthesis transport protein